jgi:hypothetical protein
MRLLLAAPPLAGLVIGWAALAQADTPPAAPIFYCPAQVGPAALSAKPAACAPNHAPQSHARHAPNRPTGRVALAHHRTHGPAATKAVASNDVSASQAFIYRYEQALHGLDARAADQAWAEGRGRPCLHGPDDHCFDRLAHNGPAGAHIYAQRTAAPNASPNPAPAPPPPPASPVRASPPVPAAPPARAYAWQDNHSGHRDGERVDQSERAPPRPLAQAWQDGHSRYGDDERVQERERAGGWRYSEVDGQGHYQHWGDHFAGEPQWRDRVENDRDIASRDDGFGERRFDAPVRHSGPPAAGRDAAGYLTWPGKTE